MCHYITAVLPRTASVEALDRLARTHGRALRPLESPGVVAQLARNEAYFLTTEGGCDCGTPIGAARRDRKPEPDWAAKEARLLKQGWSRAKAARAMAQKRADYASNRERAGGVASAGAEHWLRFIEAVLASGHTTQLGVLLHWYEGALAASFEIAGRESVSAADLIAEQLGQWREDVLYVIRP